MNETTQLNEENDSMIYVKSLDEITIPCYINEDG